MEKRKVVDKRSVRLEDFDKPDYIPFLEGRPHRETVISGDDMTNLAIALNTSSSLEELLKNM